MEIKFQRQFPAILQDFKQRIRFILLKVQFLNILFNFNRLLSQQLNGQKKYGNHTISIVKITRILVEITKPWIFLLIITMIFTNFHSFRLKFQLSP